MILNISKGKWTEVKGEIFKKWGELTTDAIDKTEGNVLALAGLLEQKLGMTKVQAEEQLNDLIGRYSEKIEDFKTSTSDKVNAKVDSAKKAVKEASAKDITQFAVKALSAALIVGVGIVAVKYLSREKR